MLELVKSWLRRNRFLYDWSRRVYGSLFIRFWDKKAFVRYRLAQTVKALSGLVTQERLVGGVMTDGGDYYLRMPDGILVFYNVLHPQSTPGDGQNLEFKSGTPTPELEAFIQGHLSNEAVYFDVGANNGYFYCLKVARAYPRCRIHAFEPDSRILGALQKNIEFNGAVNATVVPVALSDVAGVGRMPAYMGASGYLVSRTRDDVLSVDVQVSTLDRYVREQRIDRLDLIKVDIEGGEYRFLKGGRKTLMKLQPLVVMELREDLLRRSQASVEEVVGLLSRLRYVGYRVAGTADCVFLPQEGSASFLAENGTWLRALELVRSDTGVEGPRTR